MQTSCMMEKSATWLELPEKRGMNHPCLFAFWNEPQESKIIVR